MWTRLTNKTFRFFSGVIDCCFEYLIVRNMLITNSWLYQINK